MTSRHSQQTLNKVMNWIATQPTAVTLRMVAAGLDRSEDGIGKIMVELKRTGRLVGVRGTNSSGNCSFLYHAPTSILIVPPGVDFRQIGTHGSIRDEDRVRQITVKDWSGKPFRHWLDVALFGPAPVRSEA